MNVERLEPGLKGTISGFLCVSSHWETIVWPSAEKFRNEHFAFLRYALSTQYSAWLYNWFAYGDMWFLPLYHYATGQRDLLEHYFFPRDRFCFLHITPGQDVANCTSAVFSWYRVIFICYFLYLSLSIAYGTFYYIFEDLCWHSKSLSVWRVLREEWFSGRGAINGSALRTVLNKLPNNYLLVLAQLREVMPDHTFRMLLKTIVAKNLQESKAFEVPLVRVPFAIKVLVWALCCKQRKPNDAKIHVV